MTRFADFFFLGIVFLAAFALGGWSGSTLGVRSFMRLWFLLMEGGWRKDETIARLERELKEATKVADVPEVIAVDGGEPRIDDEEFLP